MNIFEGLLSNKTVRLFHTSILTKLLIVSIGVINSVLINRYLGVELRGEYTTTLNIANLLQLILNLGIGSIYPAFKRKNIENVKDMFFALIIFQFIIYLIIFLALITFVEVNFKYELIITIVSIVETQIISLAIVEDVVKKNKTQIFTSLIYTILLFIVFLLAKSSLNTLLIIVIFNQLFFIMMIVYKFKLYSISINLISKELIKDVLRLGMPSMIMNLLIFCNYNIDILILHVMTKDYYAIGLYGTAVTLANMLWIVPDAFKDILFNRSAKKDNVDEIVVSIIFNIFLCFLIIIVFVFIGKQFLIFMYGNEYADAFHLVLILFSGIFTMILYKLIHPIYISNGKPNSVVKILLISVVLNVICNVLLIPVLGTVGSAVSTVLSYSICGVIFLMKFKKDFNVNFINIIRSIVRKHLIKR
ncbi:lipid II flippase MurJ [Paenibacillus sp. Soil750]|uniref:lipid II flippase MurJ n=1 Tax=Paenibacillus sp. Soil750 TaxID=1736398 RepID=UPI0006F6F20B|nr:polysaccharide biosynthesis C-terminal domain-containing protein [Paenibacillus sp. Soil750]KRE57653.1 hypothetical protein ASL11_32645 [Paenibacillus sp. Soil750]